MKIIGNWWTLWVFVIAAAVSVMLLNGCLRNVDMKYYDPGPATSMVCRTDKYSDGSSETRCHTY